MDFTRIKEMFREMNIYGYLKKYFILGSFDGSITAISVVLASFISKESSFSTLILGLSGLIGISVSSGGNAFIVEIRDAEAELKKLEGQMAKSMKGSYYDRALKLLVVLSSLAHAASPLIGVVILLIYSIIGGYMGLFLSLCVTFSLLFVMGTVFEREVKEGIVTGLYMLVAGVVTLTIIYVITLKMA
ncbi:hypothetical protein HS7_08300 [Sulfolobales archaeon HS-7]|nr:hypothetical protein HS7_08300 [Sulfolobales archaeon HS-7]